MSRSGYIDDIDNWQLICWRGAVSSALKGKRGQKTLVEIRDALDNMSVKELVADSLVSAEGQFCTLGALGFARGMELSELDPDDLENVADKFDIAEAMAREIVYENDENSVWLPFPERETPAMRWKRMRDWVNSHIRQVNIDD